MSKNKTISKAVEPSTPAGEKIAFIRGMFSDLAPAPNEDTSGSNITSAVLNNTERAYAELIAAMLGDTGSLSRVLRVALRRLIVEGQTAGIFPNDESEKA